MAPVPHPDPYLNGRKESSESGKLETEYMAKKSDMNGKPSQVELNENSTEVKIVVVADDPSVNAKEEVDPWALPEFQDNSLKWNELTLKGKLVRVFIDWFGKAVCLIGLLYLFICSLDFLSSAFRLLGGKAAGEAFSSNVIVNNPVCGVMIGVLATVLVQSSSTSTSIVVAMVSADILDVPPAIPIVMGANIGTSVTNTIVSVFQAADRSEYRRAFAGATVHDVFNWLSVIILLIIEVATHYLFHLTEAITKTIPEYDYDSEVELLKVITKPFTDLIVMIDKNVIKKIAKGEVADGESLLKRWCDTGATALVERNVTEVKNVTESVTKFENGTSSIKNVTALQNVTHLESFTESVKEKCDHLFVDTTLSDSVVGIILLVVSLIILCVCLVLIVKLLHSMLRGHLALIIRRTVNADFPGRLAFLTGYLAILVGAGLTILVQSSSIFTSALTPLVGVGVVSLERAYPLTLGANIGTTATGIMAALASSGGNFINALQIALCHLFFNISGILIWYPIPFMRRVPVEVAKILGNTTAKYRWFAGLYLIIMFFLLPALIFGLSLAGPLYLICIGGPLFLLFCFVVIVNVLQAKRPKLLRKSVLRDWSFLPLWMHSLGPLDKLFTQIGSAFHRCKSQSANKYHIAMHTHKGDQAQEPPPQDLNASKITYF